VKADSQASIFAVNAGAEHLRRNDLAAAIEKFREAVRLDPHNAQAHYQLAIALRRRGALAEARKEFDEARRLAPYLRPPAAPDK